LKTILKGVEKSEQAKSWFSAGWEGNRNACSSGGRPAARTGGGTAGWEMELYV
jgi:hypothetical protein